MQKKPLVSIIINCLNGEKYLDKAIKSVLVQNYQNWEIKKLIHYIKQEIYK